ncbi:MAG: ChrR family anti-sigma-E factor [Alphaproteobacteria bacterium]|nr:ChrR family anti-sigma-E factor [Alphaproteobacteria bacterium]
MNISHHPSEDLLLDYASGALGEAWSLAVATHLALCPGCRRVVSGMEALGGSMLDSIVPAPTSRNTLNAVMTRLDAMTERDAAVPAAPPADGHTPILPQPLRGYAGADADGLNWQRLGLGAYQMPIPTGDKGVTARLLRIPAGRPVPKHSHGGLELTLVLSGAFSDATGSYGRGDLQAADENLEHQPHAEPGEDCICLAITDAPLRFSSLAARMVQPLLGI